MSAASKQQLIEILEGIAKELHERPAALDAEYKKRETDGGDTAIDALSRWPRQAGALESLCEFSSASIYAAVETFLKPPPRRRGKR